MGLFDKTPPVRIIEGIVERYGLGGVDFGQGFIVLRGDLRAYMVVFGTKTMHELILTQPGDKVRFAETGGNFENLTMKELGIHR
jgi:hypothetical protein